MVGRVVVVRGVWVLGGGGSGGGRGPSERALRNTIMGEGSRSW